MYFKASGAAFACAIALGAMSAAFAAPRKPVNPPPSPGPDPSYWPCRQIGSRTVCEFRLGDQVFFLDKKDLSILKSLSDRNQKLLQSNSPNQ